MKLHGNARTCPKSRRLLVERIESSDCSLREAADAAGISERTAYRWLKRWREEGADGLLDRSSAPRRIAHCTAPERVQAITAGEQIYNATIDDATRWDASDGTTVVDGKARCGGGAVVEGDDGDAEPCRVREQRRPPPERIRRESIQEDEEQGQRILGVIAAELDRKAK